MPASVPHPQRARAMYLFFCCMQSQQVLDILLNFQEEASECQPVSLTRSAPVPLSACTVALRPSAMTLLCSPNASLALSSLNLGLPVMPRYS